MTKSFEEFREEHAKLEQEGLDLGYIFFNEDGAIEFANPEEKAERERRDREYRERIKAEREAEFNKLWEWTPNETKEATK